MNTSEIKIYESQDGEAQIEVRLNEETIWLSQKQMAELFEKDSDTISLHLKNIYSSGELDEISTTEESSVVQREGKRNVTRKIKFYNLDAIISVGYRVNSKRGTQFRMWANKVLKEYLVKGYALNEARLKEKEEQLKEVINAVQYLSGLSDKKELSSVEQGGILKIIKEYTHALTVLDQYDHQELKIEKSNNKEHYRITYQEAKDQIQRWREYQKATDLFGNEKDGSFEGSLNTIYQTFDGKELYPSLEEKAANLIYFIIKNHPFSDGNKRIAAGIFAWFLDRNKILYKSNGHKRIADNTLVALTLMVAESKAEEKEMMVKVVVNLINDKN
ncbi:MAG: virulence protein RhuM/Fic/DOC family protein [Chitinophagales bacterium]|nr:virulence protein RhuM/Fic/DOC family protein [Bacteroidota bacterium]MCB9256352.1 virulence protein RhuM/Fic/DOC family protein [Chitinophagales bacterium]